MKLFVSLLTVSIFFCVEAISTKGAIDCQIEGTVAENATSGFLLNAYNGGLIAHRLANNTIGQIDITKNMSVQTWSFIPSQGPYFDLITEVDGRRGYLGVDGDGFLRLIVCSSNGNQLVQFSCLPCRDRCPYYATTIWKFNCDGKMQAVVNNQTLLLYFSAPNVARYTLTKQQPSYTVLFLPIFISIKPITPKDLSRTNHNQFSSGKATYFDNFIDVLDKYLPILLREPKRCKPGEKIENKIKLAANGCGTDTGLGYYVPELFFHSCCNGHDDCWSDCSKSFDECNREFGDCMRQQCPSILVPRCNLERCDLIEFAVDYVQSEPEISASRSQFHFCHGAALVYQFAVSTKIGANNFAAASSEACTCVPEAFPKCNVDNFAASPLLAMKPASSGTWMGFPIGDGPTELAKACEDCCRKWAESLNGKSGCCILAMQYQTPGNVCAPTEFVNKCCCGGKCPCN